MTVVGVGTAQADSADCCSCAFDETRIYPAHGDFQCSFAYPANWEARYDPWENTVYISAPRCKQRCGGARNITFKISKGKDNNADTEEAEALKQGFVKPVGKIS